MNNITVSATRTKLATTKEVENVEVTFRLFNPEDAGDNKSLSIIKGGVTGYESFYIKDASISRMRIGGWRACMGTAGRWDSLEISAESMGKVFDHYGLK